ncbi:MAG: neutral/alkaline non-lysosomal ceramidase N-terminal domain-containing protein [Candidatus Aminicenantes bacterium]|nr:neutral/alkaline non-lysosomal ceramidase N-terminal domain-containing protein [Candidatus Aminicenantes bacterium]
MKKQKWRYRFFLLFFAAVIVFTGGCGKPVPLRFSPGEFGKPNLVEGQETLLAGAAKTGITPPPGLPTGGYSMLASFGRGVRNKLMARVIYIKPKTGSPVVLVQCDLLSSSLLVHQKVAELIKKETDVDPGGLMIAGTHTHSAPANFFGSNLRNNIDSNRMGLCADYFCFLCKQIAKAVLQAYKNRRPARIATGKTGIRGVAVNRGICAYLRNENIKSKIKETGKKPGIYDAVNHDFNMIRVDCLDDDGKYKPMGVFSTFSIHNNTNPQYLDKLYNGDVLAFVERILENKIKQDIKKEWGSVSWPDAIVHAVVNCSHGDNNPDYKYTGAGHENFKDLRELGSNIAGKAHTLFKSLQKDLKSDVDVQFRAKALDVFKDNRIAGVKIATKPKLGMAQAGGGQGRGRSTIASQLPFFAPGWPRLVCRNGEQGVKRILLGPFQYCIYKKSDFPHFLLLQVIQVGDTVLLPVPWEVTYETGVRFAAYAEEMWQAAGKEEPARFVPVSCANGYWGYVTTKEEYSLQYYEGASNVYGPNTGQFIKLHLGELVKYLAGEGTVIPFRFEPEFKLKVRNCYPEKITPHCDAERAVYEKPRYHPRTKRKEAYWSFKWYDVLPYFIDLHEPLVGIQVLDHRDEWVSLTIDGIKVDDSGSDISIRFYKNRVTKKKMGLYEARWYNPPREEVKVYRFVIEPRRGEVFCLKRFYSPAFK